MLSRGESAPVDVFDLRCEGRDAPIGLGTGRPRLSWRLRGEAVASHRVTVSGDGAELWDSGERPGDDVAVVYAGPALRSRQACAWSVTVTAPDGTTATASSAFELGLLDPADWCAAWIGRATDLDRPLEPPQETDDLKGHRGLAPCAHLRRAFRADAPVVRARVYATARGLHRLSLNGRRVGDAELAPGWTDYHRRVHVHAFDVTDLVRPGDNVLGAVLADGWWSGYVGFDPRRPAQLYGEAPELLVQLELEHADGTRTTVATDAAWEEREGPVVWADLLHGEGHDARRAVPGWDAPGAAADGWRPAAVLGTDRTTLEPAPDEPVRVTETLPAHDVTVVAPGVQRIDFGQNLVGRVRLTVRGARAGDRLELRHAEALEDDGRLHTANLRTAAATDVFVSAGEPVETFEPLFTFHGFRHVELTGHPGALDPADATALVLHSDVERAGRFACSDPGLERLARNVEWGLRGNVVSVPTDCPQRDERLGWLADLQVFLPTACFLADVRAFCDKWLDDVRDAQGDDGAFPNVAPHVPALPRRGAPAWGDAGVLVPWHLFRVYGDERVLERALPSMVAWVDHVDRHNPDHVWRHATGPHFGDWLNAGEPTDRDLLATAYFARSADLTARAAAIVGNAAEAERIGALARTVRATFQETFGDALDTQTAAVLALAFGLVDDPQPVADALAADVAAHGDHLTTGFLGVGLLAPVLCDHGHAGTALALLHQDTPPSWLFPVRAGATTIWERWDGWTPEHGFQAPAMNSFNHYALGSVGAWLFEGLGGIRQAPEDVGFRDLVVEPVLDPRLDWVRAEHACVRGTIATHWHREGDAVVLDLELPPGTTAVVRLGGETRTVTGGFHTLSTDKMRLETAG